MLSEPASDVRVVGSSGDGERMGGTARAVRRVGYGIARGLVAALSLALLLTTGYGWSVYRTVNEGLITSEAIDASTPPPAPDQPFTALLVGLDSRTDAAGNPLPPELLTRLRAGDDEGQLHTDTIILLHVPTGPDADAVAISIPRDSFVEIAGARGMHKINSAYGRAMVDAEDDLAAQRLSGPELDRRAREAGRRTLVATVEQLTGAQIDHYAEINLAGFVDITEAVGGVPVCLKRPEREVRSGIDLPAGLADRARRRRAGVRAAAPRSRRRRPRPHRPPAGVPRRAGEPAAVRRDAHRPPSGAPARRRGRLGTSCSTAAGTSTG